MKKTAKIGHITIPPKALVQPHELSVAKILSWTGENIEFIVPKQDSKTPDIMFRGKTWEIKSPTGQSPRTIENNIRKALKQSPNVILDLTRTKLKDDKCIEYAKKRAQKLGKQKSIIVITKQHKILQL